MAEQTSGAPPAEQQGGQSGQTADKPAERTFTQAELNSILASHKRELQTKIEGSDRELAVLRDSVKGYEEKVASIDTMLKSILPEEEEADPFEVDDARLAEAMKPPAWAKTASDKALWRHLKKTQLVVGDRDKVLQDQLKELEGKATAADARWKKAEERELAAENKRRETLKRETLTTIHTKGDGVDLRAVQRYFADDLVFSDKADAWLYRSAGGELVDPLGPDGPLKDFPAFLQKSTVQNGGSGSGGQHHQAPESELAAAKKDMDHWGELGQKGNRQAVSRYQEAKRRVRLLEQQVKQGAHA